MKNLIISVALLLALIAFYLIYFFLDSEKTLKVGSLPYQLRTPDLVQSLAESPVFEPLVREVEVTREGAAIYYINGSSSRDEPKTLVALVEVMEKFKLFKKSEAGYDSYGWGGSSEYLSDDYVVNVSFRNQSEGKIAVLVKVIEL